MCLRAEGSLIQVTATVIIIFIIIIIIIIIYTVSAGVRLPENLGIPQPVY
jgi:hypothetical protein